ncbi:MAG: HAD-IIIA family hydrolase [Deltaproteobacteria bacterium]|nr:HAD-IIIA family hydrolase [Deltaproteobacteria bacterium]
MNRHDKFVFLDRDGVINEDRDDYVKSWDEMVVIPAAMAGLKLLHQHRIRAIVITNQSGIGRGLITESGLQEMHHNLRKTGTACGGQIEAIYYCPHHPDAGCPCRKPGSALFLQAAQEHGIGLDRTCYVGDSVKDIRAGQALGMKTVLVLTGKGKRSLERLATTDLDARPGAVVNDLWEAACLILDLPVTHYAH